jgi:hypothetical protein
MDNVTKVNHNYSKQNIVYAEGSLERTCSENEGLVDLSVPTKYLLKLKLKLIYDRQSVGQSVLVSGAHLGPVINFSFSLKFPLDSWDFVILWHPL